MRLFFPRNRYLAAVLFRLHHLGNPDIERILGKYQISFQDKTVFIKPKTISRKSPPK